MQRVLLASADSVLVKELVNQLREDYIVKTCSDGDSALDLLFSFDPDVLLMDMRLPGTDSFTVIRTVRTAGKTVGIVAVSALINDYICKHLETLKVNCLVAKPCKVSTVASHIRDVAFCVRYPDVRQWCLENEVDNILMDLGFRMGPERYAAVRCGILAKYHAPESAIMKDIYFAVVQARGGNSRQAEKAIRDAIKAAWVRGIPGIWQLYFPPGRDGLAHCPTNEEFITRIANCLHQRSRIKKPYILAEEKVI